MPNTTAASAKDRIGRVTLTPAPPTLWDAPPQHAQLALCVLASSSAGNCSVLTRTTDAGTRATLIDAGLSPRKTRTALAALNLALHHIDDVVFTHLDRDHCHPGWADALPRHACFRLHRRHLKRAERIGIARRHTRPFDDTPVEYPGRLTLAAQLLEHDNLGVAVLRFDLHQQPALGWATDLGRPSDTLVNHLAGVHTLAIESNYCPRMQADSPRPAFLKHRITGGKGHLSNQQSAEVVRATAPTSRAVLLHLSRECNTPDRARRAHQGHATPLTLADHLAPTPLLRLQMTP